jgi:hypothetical protein
LAKVAVAAVVVLGEVLVVVEVSRVAVEVSMVAVELPRVAVEVTKVAVGVTPQVPSAEISQVGLASAPTAGLNTRLPPEPSA